MDNTVLAEICRIMNVEEKEIKNLKRFSKGMSNYTYQFTVGSDKYVIRMIGNGASKYIDYYNELNAILVISNLKLTSELIYYDPITGTKICRYIEGDIYDFSDDNTNNITNLIKSLKELHNIKTDVINNYDLFNRLNKYESFVDVKLLNPTYFKIKDWLIDTYNKKYINEELVLCHNDLQDANIINSKDKVYFIDFEYCSYNDIYYDFASFEEDAYYVFEQYYQTNINNEQKNHIDFYKIYQSIQWFLVATYKESIGFSKNTNYNFQELADYFINTAETYYKKLT